MRKTTCMAVFVLAITCLTLLIPMVAFAQEAEDEIAPRGVFINITTGTEDLQKCSMALALAGKCLEAGREVTVFLNVHAIELAVTEQDAKMYNTDDPIRSKVAGLIKDGAAVLVCPMCLANSVYSEDNLLPGVQVAGGDSFFPPLDDGAAVFSY